MRAHVFVVLPALLWFAATSSPGAAVTFQSGETPATLVELFTSEGCSSCPPADAWVSKLKRNPNLWKRIVPVVFHVDYWNGLGWPDRFASAENTARQRRYAAAWGTDSIYTPGMVLNGREWRDWFARPALPEPSSVKVGRLSVTLQATEIDIVFASRGVTAPARENRHGEPPALFAEIAFLAGDLESDVTRGENRGRKLRHDFTVVHFVSTPLRIEEGNYRAVLPRPVKLAIPPAAMAIWITPGEAQPPIQATGGWLTGG